MTNRIADLPDHERPRERLRRLGAVALTERELLALILRQGRRGASALDVAGSILLHFGSLFDLASVDASDLAQMDGVGDAKAASVVAALALGGRAHAEPARISVKGPESIAAVATAEIGRLARERALVVVCDSANRVRHVEMVSHGAIDHTLLPIREVLQLVFRRDGRAFAVAHNHPSGDVRPSAQDVEVTRQLRRAAEVVGLRFLDHVIVSGSDWTTVE